MTTQGLAFVSQMLYDSDINYSFGEWSGTTVYPYFVGEYSEIPSDSENGESECVFVLTGTTDGSRLSLEEVKQKLQRLFPETGMTHVFSNGDGIAIMYSDSFYIPTNTVKYKRIQVNLKIKEWRI